MSTLALRSEATPLNLNINREALRSLREQTATQIDGLELPQVDLHRDIAGYQSLKDRVQSELIDLALASTSLKDPQEIELAESLTPKGILFMALQVQAKPILPKQLPLLSKQHYSLFGTRT